MCTNKNIFFWVFNLPAQLPPPNQALRITLPLSARRISDAP
jgi:hypothetical protein